MPAQAMTCHVLLQFYTSPEGRYASFAGALEWSVFVWTALDPDHVHPAVARWLIPGSTVLQSHAAGGESAIQ